MSAAQSRLRDSGDSYGWLSIALHWLAAIALPVIWFAGDSISTAGSDGYRAALTKHVSLALGAYLILWLRILWRFRVGHPEPLARQSRIFTVLGNAVHYAILVLIAIMLITGPLILWTRGEGIPVFGWFTVPSPFALSVSTSLALYAIHAKCAQWLAILVLLHLCGVVKRVAVDRDGTFDRMLSTARRRRTASPSPPDASSAS